MGRYRRKIVDCGFRGESSFGPLTKMTSGTDKNYYHMFPKLILTLKIIQRTQRRVPGKKFANCFFVKVLEEFAGQTFRSFETEFFLQKENKNLGWLKIIERSLFR